MHGTVVSLRKIGKRVHTASGLDLFRGIGIVLVGLAVLSSSAWPAQQQERKEKALAQSDQSAAPVSSRYDPVRAEKDIEVGTFYMHKGDIDAAILRFQDAVRYRPKYAKPRLLLGKAYEKKGDRAMAVKAYKGYLRVFPHAPDAKKIQKKIDKLSASKK
jgi:tetratricopeptide (TPR) repeat protein